MRRIAAYALLLIPVAFGQTPKAKFMTPNELSPPAETSVAISGKQIWIVYHAPSVRGRKIFGGVDALQPDDSVWRLGADQATFLHTDADLDIDGLKVPKGEYTLFAALDKGKWELIVNKQTGQWGINNDGSANRDPKNDVGKTALTMSKAPKLVEKYKITLSSAGGDKGKLQIEFENVVASVPFTAK